MKYRIENIDVPETRGIARPEDESRDLNGRRIVHVLGVDPGPAGQGATARVLTEESD